MNIIEKTQTYSYQDNNTDEFIAKGGYLVSDLLDEKDLDMQGGGVGVIAFRDFFKDLSIPTGLHVYNRPEPIGPKPRVLDRTDTIMSDDFNKLLEAVFASKPRGEQTHKKKQEKPKMKMTRKKQ